MGESVAMKTHVPRFTRVTIAGVLAAIALLWSHSVPSHAAKRVLNRSIYIPIQFSLCEHLSTGVLYINDRVVAHLPTERVFQFTYYPKLNRLAPAEIQVRVEGIDANGDPTEPGFDVFETGETFKSIEIGYTSGSDRLYFDNIHLTFWQSDESEDGSRAEDKGATFSAAWFIDNTWMPFLRAGVSDGTAALFNRSLSTGVGWYMRNQDLAAIGLNWAEAKGFDDRQFTAEAFYRFNISPAFQLTPSIQYISNPLLDPGSDDLTILGFRARIVF